MTAAERNWGFPVNLGFRCSCGLPLCFIDGSPFCFVLFLLWEGVSIRTVLWNFFCLNFYICWFACFCWKLDSQNTRMDEWERANAQPQTYTHIQKKKTCCHTKTPTQLPQNSMTTNNEFQKEKEKKILPRSLEPETSPGGEDVLIIRCCVCGLTTMPRRLRREKGQDILPSDAKAWSSSPHTTLSNS